MQSKEIGEKVLRQTQYGVRVEGTVVVMTIGKKNVRMDYETALKLSAFLRHGGRMAKRISGDQSRKWTVFSDLTDANLDELEAQRSRDGTAVFNRH
jgi:alpha-glucuronidase